MKCVATIAGLEDKTSIKQMFNRFETEFNNKEGYCYYKYPLAGGIDRYLPDLTIILKEKGFLVIDSIEYSIDNIQINSNNEFTINGTPYDNPILLLEDYEFSLSRQYERYRHLRNKITINSILLMPNISENEFCAKFPEFYSQYKSKIIFENYIDIKLEDLWGKNIEFNDEDWKYIISITQGADILTSHKSTFDIQKSEIQGEAIEAVNQQLALLDNEQFDAAVQIPNSAQRIRGLAGTGKTIILCMKAAYYHQRYPEHKILYTFNTQSLYGQIESLITRFYEAKENGKPNWENLKIMHSWGGKTKRGVYYDTCIKNDITPSTFRECNDFSVLCQDLLNKNIKEEYDIILMDEAQDFPPSFYQLVYKLSKKPKRIIWAYDELQSLEGKDIPDTGKLFGYSKDGNKIIDLQELYNLNNIETDMILKKSYRNPIEILMLAHSIGLGLYSSSLPVQMIDKKDIWESIGYKVKNKDFEVGEETIINRPYENSPNPVQKFYTGKQEPITTKSFDTKKEELEWVAKCIENDIKQEKVAPEEIVVITLNTETMKRDFVYLQDLLYYQGIFASIPGIDANRDVFKKEGYVTLSTVPKAKGNEAFKVYVIGFDYLYKAISEVSIRNKAFVSISRAKGWCILTGCGDDMKRAQKEIKHTLDNVPNFIFPFPDMSKIKRKLSTEEYRKKAQQIKKYNNSIEDMLNADVSVLKGISKEKIQELLKKLSENENE